jgi:hypothetical protein
MQMQSNPSFIARCARRPLFWGCLLLWLMVAAPASAQVPRLISYQGSLADGDFPSSDTLSMQFDFFDQATGGTALWTDERPEVVVNQGRFSVLLGEETAFPEGLFEAEDGLYLRVTVEGEVLSRFQMTSTPYALRASVAETVLENAVSTDAIADGAVTSAKISPNAITSGQVVNDALTSDDIAAGAIGSGELANGAVTNSKIQDGSISSSKLGPGSVGTGQLVDGSVTAEIIGANAVNENKIDARNSPESGDFLKYVDGELEWNDDLFSDATNQPSSRRWKTDIQTIDSPLQLVEQLRGVRYIWEEDGRADIGLIAEEVGNVVPEVVTYEENGVDARTVNYGRLVGVLVESIKQQQREIEQQEEAMNDLRERVEQLEQLIRRQAQQ